MITFLQRSLSDPNTYATSKERKVATHFTRDGGPIRPLGELLVDDVQDNDVVDNSFVANIPPDSNETLPEPLPMPVMNFGEQDEQVNTNSEHLMLPKMNFDKKGKSKKATGPTVSLDGIEPLPLPSMQF